MAIFCRKCGCDISSDSAVSTLKRKTCRECHARYMREYNSRERDRTNEKARERWHRNKDRNNAARRTPERRAKAAAARRERRLRDGDRIREVERSYRSAHSEQYRGYAAKHYQENREKVLASCREYRKTEQCKENRRRRHRERLGEGGEYAVAKRARSLVYSAFSRRGYSKNTKTATLLGCSWDHLVAHLASLCYGGMTVEDILANDGRVHIDHITPLATAKTEEDVVRLNHYTNLQPLWAADNLEKSDRLDWVHPRDRA